MYREFYHLSAKPFQLGTDPRFFFGSRGHKRAMSYLQYGISQGEGFIVITGDIGTGKTTLVQTLFSELDTENMVAAQLVTTQLEADDILRMVAAAFGLAHEGLSKASLLKNMETFLVTRTREGKRVLLVVDEAHNIPPRSLEELRMLSNFQVGGKALLQSFLIGQQEFRAILQSDGMEQLRQRVIAAYHLNPLDRDEVSGYIEHRLKLVGWQNDPSFTSTAYDVIHDYTQGVPRRINTLCDRLMLFGYLEQLHQITEESVNTVISELKEEISPTQSDAHPEDIFANKYQADVGEKPDLLKKPPTQTSEPLVNKPVPATSFAGKTAGDARNDASLELEASILLDETERVAGGNARNKSPQQGKPVQNKTAKKKTTTKKAAQKEDAASTGPENLGSRINALEEKVNELEIAFRHSQARLRRAFVSDEDHGEV